MGHQALHQILQGPIPEGTGVAQTLKVFLNGLRTIGIYLGMEDGEESVFEPIHVPVRSHEEMIPPDLLKPGSPELVQLRFAETSHGFSDFIVALAVIPVVLSFLSNTQILVVLHLDTRKTLSARSGFVLNVDVEGRPVPRITAVPASGRELEIDGAYLGNPPFTHVGESPGGQLEIERQLPEKVETKGLTG